ncbi:HrpB1 family type III secretion system apparatus protein [Burkholderia ubonensis]|uniref:HrpB1 family type III secretion system apparatus protein n=1 Tax=Burkholderia ubonensis TaxID=101571 RepID=UPI0007541FBF|nr:HrpB1 family type III secretion system apparatus protein [Burkholderia ubonensis]KVZ68315.1 type III secretion protein [Burkholderia ubonensis]OJA31030.1 type III secretion protein [Burkholderia ubonensis]OJB28185.1 type III secretion protein [Burkholderia ubonensis]
MVVGESEYLNCSNEIVGGLIETVSVALFRDFPSVKVDLEDVEKVVGALTVLRPRVVEIETLSGVLHMFRGNWGEAMHVLRSVCERAPKFSYARMLLAVCMSTSGDSGWRRVAAEAMELGADSHAEALVRVMQAREDLDGAIQVQQSGGAFAMPASCAALIAEQGVDAGMPEASAGNAAESVGYLRL